MSAQKKKNAKKKKNPSAKLVAYDGLVAATACRITLAWSKPPLAPGIRGTDFQVARCIVWDVWSVTKLLRTKIFFFHYCLLRFIAPVVICRDPHGTGVGRIAQ